MVADKDLDAAESLILFSQIPRNNESHHTREGPTDASHREVIATRSTDTGFNPPRNREDVLQPNTTRVARDTSIGVQNGAYAAPNPPNPPNAPNHPQRGTRPRRIEMTPANALQAYLIRQQLIAGIPPERMIPMTGPLPYPVPGSAQFLVNHPNAPSVVQVSNRGVNVPRIHPASFNGAFYPPYVFPPPQMVQGQIYGPPGFGPGWVTAYDSQVQAGVVGQHPGFGVPAGPAAVSGTQYPGSGMESAPGGVVRQGRWDGSDESTTQFHSRGASNGHIQGQLPFRPASQSTGNMNGSQTQGNGQTLHQRETVAGQGPSASDPNHRVASRVEDARPRSEVGEQTQIPHNGFDLLAALSRHLDVAQMIIDYLDLPELLNIYCISKPCNGLCSINYQRTILRHALLNAPQSARVFPFICYPKLYIPEKYALMLYNPMSKAAEVHTIPTFRWLAMIRHREAIVNEIIQLMEQEGLKIPDPCGLVIKKLWFLMDIPDNQRREWTIRNRKLWEDIDIFFAMFFLVQVDICLRKRHNLPNGALRRLVMAQPSLTFLWKVLNNTALTNQFDVVDAFVRWQYTPARREPGMYIFGVPSEQVGLLQYEGYYPREGAQRLQRPDELIVYEMARRRLHMQSMYRDIFLLNNPHAHTTPGSRTAQWDYELRSAIQGSDADWLDCVRLEQV